MTKKNDTIQSFKFRGTITGTSNKQSADFTNENPRKTAYVKVDDDNKKILLENGLTLYTSKEKEDFFIIKMSEKIAIWEEGNKIELDTSVGTDNFSTEEVNIACIKGKNKGNDFVRIYALGVKVNTDIKVVEQENPFL